jgi:hypothetical protein
MDDPSSIAPVLLAGQTVDTQLTTNCNAQTEASFDVNDTTWVTFYFQNKVPLWRALLSIATTQVTLIQSVQACGITLSEGLQLTLNSMGCVYTVLLNGVIIDTGVTYRCEGVFLGSFSRSPEMKSAVQLIRAGRVKTNASGQFPHVS